MLSWRLACLLLTMRHSVISSKVQLFTFSLLFGAFSTVSALLELCLQYVWLDMEFLQLVNCLIYSCTILLPHHCRCGVCVMFLTTAFRPCTLVLIVMVRPRTDQSVLRTKLLSAGMTNTVVSGHCSVFTGPRRHTVPSPILVFGMGSLRIGLGYPSQALPHLLQ